MDKTEVERLNVDELCDLIGKQTYVSEEVVTSFRDNKISGKILSDLTAAELREMIPVIGERKVIEKNLKTFQLTPAAKVSENTANKFENIYVCFVLYFNSQFLQPTNSAVACSSACWISDNQEATVSEMQQNFEYLYHSFLFLFLFS